MARKLIFGDNARTEIRDGIQQLASAVKVTLGPKGRNVILDRRFSDPTITKDGVSVADDITLSDSWKNIGVKIAKQTAKQTAKDAGDGTTTATCLVEAIYCEGLRYLTAGANPMDMKRGIEEGVACVMDYLAEHATPVTNNKQIEQVATISANNDEVIGKVIAEAIATSDNLGSITFERNKTPRTVLDVTEGIRFEKGFVNTRMANKKGAETTIFNEVSVLVVDEEIDSIPFIDLIANTSAQSGMKILVICKEITEEANLHAGNLAGGISSKFCIVKADGYGDRLTENLRDLAIATGAKVIGKGNSTELDREYDSLVNLVSSSLGYCGRIVVTRTYTRIYQPGMTAIDLEKHPECEEAVEAYTKNFEDYIGGLRDLHDRAENDYQKEVVKTRISRLTTGIVVIKVGALTDAEYKEKADRVEDALLATFAAREGGVLPGGGMALMKAFEHAKFTELSGDKATGVKIVRDTLLAPFNQIILNAGESPDMVRTELKGKEFNWGYNVGTSEYGNMFEMGVIDPYKVTTCALANAASIASLLLTTECMITDEEGSIVSEMK